MSPKPSKPPTDNLETKDLSSFGATKEKVLNLLWNWIPIKLRVPFVLIVILVGSAISTQSYWKPLVDAWFFTPPPPMIFGGYVFASANEPLQTEVRVIDVKGKEISHTSSDSNGLASFNVRGDVEVAGIECKADGAWKRFAVTKTQLKQTKKFIITLSTDSITFQ